MPSRGVFQTNKFLFLHICVIPFVFLFDFLFMAGCCCGFWGNLVGFFGRIGVDLPGKYPKTFLLFLVCLMGLGAFWGCYSFLLSLLASRSRFLPSQSPAEAPVLQLGAKTMEKIQEEPIFLLNSQLSSCPASLGVSPAVSQHLPVPGPTWKLRVDF